ncbi:MAG: YbhB/YbcL family Raf kinase inhibitor-like protein [Acidobacteria bacterium]|nr:YbhB/YbcL family Raf kinase inhibitor-like protein [Acidobacteriota bacterium]
MRLTHCTVLALALATTSLSATQRPAAAPPSAPGAPAAPSQPVGQFQRRPPMVTLTFSTTAWPDGGVMPATHSQAGRDVSPPLTWGNVPDDTASFVIIAHDIDAPVGNGTDDVLHWMLWNIPKASRALPADLDRISQLPDGTRQISGTGPYYRGPAAPATGAPHHYVFDIYALDVVLNVPAVGQSPAETRAAVMAAMAGHVRGKGALVGLYRHP